MLRWKNNGSGEGSYLGASLGDELGRTEGTGVVHNGLQVARQFSNAPTFVQRIHGLFLATQAQDFPDSLFTRKVSLSVQKIVGLEDGVELGSSEGDTDGKSDGLADG